MALSLNTNISSLRAATELGKTSARLAASSERLSSGSKLSATRDAAGLAVAKNLEAALARTDATKTNVRNAVSFLEKRNSAEDSAGQILKRVTELTTLYSDITKSASDKANYSTEFSQLKAQLTNLTATKFNGVSVFGSSSPGDVKVSEDGTQSVSILAADLSGKLSTITSATTLSGITISNTSDAISQIATMQAEAGAQLSRFNYIDSSLSEDIINLRNAHSSIADTDVASESSEFTRYNILSQAGTSMLAQANQSPQTMLRLLQ